MRGNNCHSAHADIIQRAQILLNVNVRGMAYLPPASNLVPGNQVELHISCNDLVQADVLSESDPLAAVYTWNDAGNWSEVDLYST